MVRWMGDRRVVEELPEDDLVVAGAVVLPHSCYLYFLAVAKHRAHDGE